MPRRDLKGADHDQELRQNAALRHFFAHDALLWLSHPNIVGVMLGRKIAGGAEINSPAIVFRVARKLDLRADILAIGSKPLPETLTIGDHVYRTDVLEGGHSASVQTAGGYDPRQRAATICPGTSIGNHGVVGDAGTGTAVVRDRSTGGIALLSSDHVVRRRDGDALVTQPGGADGAGARDVFGRIIRGVRGLEADAAIASIDSRPADCRVAGLDVVIDRLAAPVADSLLIKIGRSTGITYGTISAAIATMWVQYNDGAPARMQGFEIRALNGQTTAPGDSGAPWLLADPQTRRPTGTLVGIHTSSTPDLQTAFACQATAAFDALGIDLVLPADLSPVHEARIASPVAIPKTNAFRVTARIGLVLRGGAGHDFAALSLLPLGTILHRLGIDGPWMRVDLRGDGCSDGFVYAAFVEAVSA